MALTGNAINHSHIRFPQMRHQPIRLELILEELDPRVIVLFDTFDKLSNVTTSAESALVSDANDEVAQVGLAPCLHVSSTCAAKGYDA